MSSGTIYLPPVPCPPNLRTFDEKGNRIATIEYVDGKLVAVPVSRDDKGTDSPASSTQQNNTFSGLSNVTATDRAKEASRDGKKDSLLKRMFRKSKNNIKDEEK
ncbi:MAG: hypothetical protein LQ346_000661 [Caloplaca aetnensis]|nr:MAG: hypothetical protein LQ346_000661 [Caloplaca aetnensis]